jgi:hypothetical protein
MRPHKTSFAAGADHVLVLILSLLIATAAVAFLAPG